MALGHESSATREMKLVVCPVTGGTIEMCVKQEDTLCYLRNILARKLHLHPEKIILLHKDRILKNGTVSSNELADNCQLTMLLNMESGNKAQPPDARVMQAIESLTDSQLDDFLTGRAPLLLAVKLGDHMMFIQLQLSVSCHVRRSVPLGNGSAYGNHVQGGAPKEQCIHHDSQVGSQANGAVIDSINNLGKGVYSGTFSGTLDSSSQDFFGRPRRDVGIIMQILNDLLGAAPHYRLLQQCKNKTQIKTQVMAQKSTDFPPSSSPPVPTEDSSLREKIQRLQMQLEERKLRRKTKRNMRSPYSWPINRTPYHHLGHHHMKGKQYSNFKSNTCREQIAKGDNHASPATTATTAAPEVSNFQTAAKGIQQGGVFV
ncbi:hypothetical protein CHS0354_026542 [Potamilus streckersoni]|uniref:Ubiquitin-like domain-containing protein n=1 Tax=Potamilus streckersoni TaxID=2493646 RepID=A0AAE0VHZ5_9BIVA|nr:hypothetical protein CHS0354_026542 [Potamilus streckersoni]